ncbi:hypothetical protein [Mycolicibacterium confluentis]|uniref:Uncharacterized protein n=1 Tax=Mycolicibacterium confluentis TaxID=28047 RepID=A0A7I7XQZ5_9MYCO|nr:hypothetical protein [Mycolicibacterium confluentis]MCV7322374.1 hypothetical protein [Mycolicibacterium confluentis]ORV28575.1 hypothetical protein AWB99_17360 [Mycolicibacterium confluentis]BBZ31422.1 hypothetical protein MCNF_00270 [Mycolicibacterium confluentis]
MAKDWRTHPVTRWVRLIVLGAGAGGAMVWFLHSIVQGDLAVASIALGLTFSLLLMLIGTAWIHMGAIRRHARWDRRGTTFEPDPVHGAFTRAMTYCLTVTAALAIVLTWTGRLAVPVDPINAEAFWKAIWAAVFLLAYGLTQAPTWFRSASPHGYLRLTDEEITFSSGWRTKRVPWSDLVDVTDQVPGRYGVPEAVRFFTATGPAGHVDASFFSDDPEALNRVVLHYWRNPDQRGQLADGSAARRFVSGQAPGGPAGLKPGTPKARRLQPVP